MRNSQKKQLLDIMTSLHLLHKEIEDTVERKEYQAVLMALNDCQEAAIQIGNALELMVGEGTSAVRYLEQYCERVYQISVQLEGLTAHKVYKKLEEILLKAEQEIKHTEVKKTVVFLPYKASMWDSLESVWRAAKEDIEWECIVMPIPYFNKNRDGSLGDMVYEGNDFPKYVPIVDWRQYSLEDEHPEMIFIHNPYDQYNYVTTIYPEFYSSKIKDYTDKLIYIPYFVHQNDVVKETYCVLPGTIYADKVILQSEKVREQYIRYYTNALYKNAMTVDETTVREKFLAMGSPKFDSVAKEMISIPEEWEEFLDKNKKIVFFNTHLNSLMKGKSEQFLKKLEWVFNFFEKRDDVVLLWRPHPLMIDTARAMNPEAVDPYLQLVKKYCQKKIGIYDDSKDLHRAIEISDIYYGDASSVAELFRQQKKTVMLMNHSVIEN